MLKVDFQINQKGRKLTAHQSREISTLWGRGFPVRTAAAQEGEGHAQSTHTQAHTHTELEAKLGRSWRFVGRQQSKWKT